MVLPALPVFSVAARLPNLVKSSRSRVRQKNGRNGLDQRDTGYCAKPGPSALFPVRWITRNAKAYSLVQDAISGSIHRRQNLTAAPAGQAFGRRSRAGWAQRRTIKSVIHAPKYIAAAAAGILDIFLVMAPSQRASAIVSTDLR